MAATGGGAIDGAGDGVNLAASFEGKVCGDERAGAAGAFDDKERTRPMSDDAISLGKGFAVGRGLKGEFGDYGSLAIGNLLGKGEVFWRVNLHQAGTENSYCTTIGGNGSFVRGCVNSTSQSRDDGEPGAGEYLAGS